MPRAALRSALAAILSAAMALPAAAAAPAPVAPPPAPAIGYDWMDPGDRADDPDPWPRADAAGAGLEDMIHDERRVVGDAIAGQPPGGTLQRSETPLLRAMRKVGGDYIVVPLLTLHLDRPRVDH